MLFDLLGRVSENEGIVFEDQAERRVLWNVECELERVLVEPFLPDYDEWLRKARDAVRDSTD